MSRDAADIGRKVLEALTRGREKLLAKRRARLELLAELVAFEVRREVAAGTSEHGRAARIARRLARAAPERTIRRVLASLPKCQTARATIDP